MKRITTHVIIEGQDHVLVQVEDNDFKEGTSTDIKARYVGNYGTIPYAWINEHGQLNRSITLLDILMSQTIGQAIENRVDQIYIEKHFYSIEDKNEQMKAISEYYKNKYLKERA